ncbi:MAG: hypothetical protein B7O98_08790 [Zestosphaera tikiterensis]|uniref:Uncharacterized protein n=1 Tax=Zestosphaera tikiterensis TaxID=1973259 RepID=A0A2R7Y2F9_9CREN|nr:MAG: hypothetical protein B7O98_08790 [Zestosphaera tikiterensis]
MSTRFDVGNYVGEGVGRRTHATEDPLEEARRLYREKGISYTLWWFIREIWARRRHAVKFEDLFRLHQYIAGARSKNSTRKALKRLEEYGLIENLGDGYYKPLIMDQAIVEGSIDFSRIRTRDQVLRNRKDAVETSMQLKDMPRELMPVVKEAQKLIERGDKWKAVDLIAHTLLPIRKTGVLIARKDDLFLYYERKTDKMHMIRSWRLTALLDFLGIKDEVLVAHRHSEADGIIRKLFGSHDNARRLHYLLKERGWFEYPAENYFYRIFENPMTHDWWISVYKLNRETDRMEEDLRVEVGRSAITGIQVKAGTIVTREHIKKENEDTYFRRTKGWI